MNIVKFINPEILKNNKIISLDDDHKLDDVLNFVKIHSINTNHPLFLNQLFGNTNKLSIIAEKIIAEMNTSMYTYEMSPVFTSMENEITKQLKNIFGFNYCESLFLPGGSICNTIAINTARYKYDSNIKFKGNDKDLIVLTSDQAHYSIAKSCMLLGIGLNNLVKISTDNEGNINLEELNKKILELKKNKKKPFIFIGTICTTVLGTIDPINELIKITNKYKIWLHLDGAVGGSFIFSNKYKKLLKGIDKVDSLCFNPHKLLNINQQSSILLSSHENLFRDSNCLEIAYLFNNDKYYDSTYDSGNKYFLCGRRPDVFKFWLVWKIKKKDYFSKLINDIFEKTMYMKKLIISNPKNFELVINNNSIMICFKILKNNKYINDNEYPNIKKKLLENNIMIPYQKCKNYGNFFRICLVNNNCKKKHIDNIINTLINIINLPLQ